MILARIDGEHRMDAVAVEIGDALCLGYGLASFQDIIDLFGRNIDFGRRIRRDFDVDLAGGSGPRPIADHGPIVRATRGVGIG